jgi:hypothetical protein
MRDRDVQWIVSHYVQHAQYERTASRAAHGLFEREAVLPRGFARLKDELGEGPAFEVCGSRPTASPVSTSGAKCFSRVTGHVVGL